MITFNWIGKRVCTDLGWGKVIDTDYDGELVIQLDIVSDDLPDYCKEDGIIMRYSSELIIHE